MSFLSWQKYGQQFKTESGFTRLAEASDHFVQSWSTNSTTVAKSKTRRPIAASEMLGVMAQGSGKVDQYIRIGALSINSQMLDNAPNNITFIIKMLDATQNRFNSLYNSITNSIWRSQVRTVPGSTAVRDESYGLKRVISSLIVTSGAKNSLIVDTTPSEVLDPKPLKEITTTVNDRKSVVVAQEESTAKSFLKQLQTPHEYIMIRMPLNPAMFDRSRARLVQPLETQGGYVFQYFGERPMSIRLSGTTGSFGALGINVLEQVYLSQVRNTGEFLTLSRFDADQSKYGFCTATDGGVGSVWTGGTIEMWYQGACYLGHFKSFSATEKSDPGGIWEYDMEFYAIEESGVRTGFVPERSK